MLNYFLAPINFDSFVIVLVVLKWFLLSCCLYLFVLGVTMMMLIISGELKND